MESECKWLEIEDEWRGEKGEAQMCGKRKSRGVYGASMSVRNFFGLMVIWIHRSDVSITEEGGFGEPKSIGRGISVPLDWIWSVYIGHPLSV